MRVARLWHHAKFFLFDNLCSHKFLVSVSEVGIDVVFDSIKLLSVSLHVCLPDRWRRILKHLVQLVIVIVELLLLYLLDLVRVIRQTIKSAFYFDALCQKLIFSLNKNQQKLTYIDYFEHLPKQVFIVEIYHHLPTHTNIITMNDTFFSRLNWGIWVKPSSYC